MGRDIIRITSKNKLLAIIIKAKFKSSGLKFFTPEEHPQQLAYMKYPMGHIITSHIHRPFLRKIKFTQEVLFIRSGKIRIDFYDKRKKYIESRIVKQGDIIFLAFGGHGFEFMEDAEMIEVKQGPFLAEMQPIRFTAVKKDKIKFKK